MCCHLQIEEGVEGIGRKREKIPLPEDFDIGLDRRGLDLNSAARKNNNMGGQYEGTFP